MGVCLEARLEMVFFHWKTKTRDGGSFGGPAGDALIGLEHNGSYSLDNQF